MKKDIKDDNKKAERQEDKSFPGYPIYPADEDIMSQKSGFKKNPKAGDGTEPKSSEDDLNPNPGGDDDELRERVWEVDMAGYDLDVPGADLDDDEEAIGEEDEENNLYSTTDDDNYE